MKLTKQQLKFHKQAETILEQDILSFDDKLFVLDNWNEAANFEVSRAGAFFTPEDLARDFEIEVPKSYSESYSYLDLCAGIGILSFWVYHRSNSETLPKIICVESNPEYVRVGKKILPEATWICADIFDYWEVNRGSLFFDAVYSNPPFGKVQSGSKSSNYLGSRFEYKVMDMAFDFSDCVSFILPSGSAPFRYSGVPFYKRDENREYKKFEEETGIYLEAGVGIDTSVYKSWKNTKIVVEIVSGEFLEGRDRFKDDLEPVKPQLDLFAGVGG